MPLLTTADTEIQLGAETPRVSFWGFCDRAKEVTEGHPAFWGWNLLGLSNARVFSVFPTTLQGTMIALAIYQPGVGESFRFVLEGANGEPSFEFVLQIASAIVSQTNPENGVTHTETTSGLPLASGWVPIFSAIGFSTVVIVPGTYRLSLVEGEAKFHLGNVAFLHQETPPHTAADIAAIKSDPLASKFIRLEMRCNKCHDSYRAYAGVEKSANLEKEGYLWSQDISQVAYSCECKATQFPLQYIRTGLHGLMRRNVDPSSMGYTSFVRLYEKTALEQSCRDFADIIAEKNDEEVVQKFLESNPIFFHLFQPAKIITKPPILTKYFADFAILNDRKELVLIELEKPHIRLLKKDGGKTADLEHAFHQIRTWVQELNDHRSAALSGFDLKLEEVARIRGIVIAGRKPQDDQRERVLRSLSNAEIELFTYDDLIGAASQLIKQIAVA